MIIIINHSEASTKWLQNFEMRKFFAFFTVSLIPIPWINLYMQVFLFIYLPVAHPGHLIKFHLSPENQPYCSPN